MDRAFGTQTVAGNTGAEIPIMLPESPYFEPQRVRMLTLDPNDPTVEMAIVMSPANTDDIGFIVNGVRNGFGIDFVEGLNVGAPSGSMIGTTFLGEFILYLKALNWAIPVAKHPGFHGILWDHGEAQIETSQGSEIS